MDTTAVQGGYAHLADASRQGGIGTIIPSLGVLKRLAEALDGDEQDRKWLWTTGSSNTTTSSFASFWT
jgi:hypothetical protein